MPPHKRVHVRQEALDVVHEHWVKGRNKEDGLFREKGRDDLQDIVWCQAHERVGETNVQMLLCKAHTYKTNTHTLNSSFHRAMKTIPFPTPTTRQIMCYRDFFFFFFFCFLRNWCTNEVCPDVLNQWSPFADLDAGM